MVKNATYNCYLYNQKLYVHQNLALQGQSAQHNNNSKQNIVLLFTLAIH